MSENWRSRRPADRTVVSIESLSIGSPKDELVLALRQFRADCADSARPDQPSGRTLALVSADLTALYRPRGNLSGRLFALSPTAISEILSGKRKGLPAEAFGHAMSIMEPAKAG